MTALPRLTKLNSSRARWGQLISAPERGQVEAVSFYNLASEVRLHHFFHILLLRQVQGEGRVLTS